MENQTRILCCTDIRICVCLHIIICHCSTYTHARSHTHIHTHTHTHGQGNVCQERWHARGGPRGRRDVGRCGRFLCVDVWDGTRAGGRGALPMAVGACMHVCISRCCEWSLARMVPLIFFLALCPPFSLPSVFYARSHFFSPCLFGTPLPHTQRVLSSLAPLLLRPCQSWMRMTTSMWTSASSGAKSRARRRCDCPRPIGKTLQTV